MKKILLLTILLAGCGQEEEKTFVHDPNTWYFPANAKSITTINDNWATFTLNGRLWYSYIKGDLWTVFPSNVKDPFTVTIKAEKE